MKILIISDNHGMMKNLEKVLELEKPIDRLIHCGDVEGTEWKIIEAAGCPCDIVAGNNDYFSDLPSEKEILVGNKKALLTHGHAYYVYMDTKHLVREAAARGLDMVVFGHTHRPLLKNEQGIMVINPGSISYPRQEGRIPSYIIMETGKGDPVFTVKYLEDFVNLQL